MAQRHNRGGNRGAGAGQGGQRGAGAGAGAQGRRDRGSGGADSAQPGAQSGRRDTQRDGIRGPGLDVPALRARLRELIDPVLSAIGYDLDAISLSRAGRRHLVRLSVDGDNGVNLDAIAEVSRAVSAALDAAEAGGELLFPGEYELQVSSPGVDRPLSLPRHWRRNTARLVQVRAGEREVTGRIMAVDDDGVVLEITGARQRFGFDALGPGRVQLEFNRIATLSDAELEDLLEPVGGGDEDDEEEDDEHESDEEKEEDGA